LCPAKRDEVEKGDFMKKRTLAGVAAAAGTISAIALPVVPAGADEPEPSVAPNGIQCAKNVYCTSRINATNYTGTPTVNWKWYVNGRQVGTGSEILPELQPGDTNHSFPVDSSPQVGDPGEFWRICAWFDGEAEPALDSCPADGIPIK
jgi:hypothetical protein